MDYSHAWLLYFKAHEATQVLAQTISDGMLTEQQAIQIAKNALFHNANNLYGLNLKPILKEVSA